MTSWERNFFRFPGSPRGGTTRLCFFFSMGSKSTSAKGNWLDKVRLRARIMYSAEIFRGLTAKVSTSSAGNRGVSVWNEYLHYLQLHGATARELSTTRGIANPTNDLTFQVLSDDSSHSEGLCFNVSANSSAEDINRELKVIGWGHFERLKWWSDSAWDEGKRWNFRRLLHGNCTAKEIKHLSAPFLFLTCIIYTLTVN